MLVSVRMTTIMVPSSKSTEAEKPISLSGLPTRVGLVGAGYIAEFHARALQAIDNVALVCVCDPNVERAHAFADAWNIALVFDSFTTMLAEAGLNSVHILTPPDQHFAPAKAALEAGLHVMVEKPMCATAEEAERLAELAGEKGLYLGVSTAQYVSLALLVAMAIFEVIWQLAANSLDPSDGEDAGKSRPRGR